MKLQMRTWTWMSSILIGLGMTTLAEESKDAKPAGPRLRVRFVETRQHGDKTISSRPCVLTLHADEKPTKVFAGRQVSLTTSDKVAPTVLFKNAGVEAQVSAQSLGDGRYRLDARFEDASVLPPSASATSANHENPILQTLKGESKVTLREGETVPFASAVDPISGDLVRVDVALAAAPAPKAVAPSPSKDARLRAQFVLTRRQGEKKTASRPYSVVLQAGGETTATVFSGSQLPLQVSNQGQGELPRPTIALKDVGAGAHFNAQLGGDGRYRVDLWFSDGSLASQGASPTLLAFESEARLFMQLGETVTVGSVVDPQTGDVVEVDLTIEAVK